MPTFHSLEFRLTPHLIYPDVNMIEVWYCGALLATIAPDERQRPGFYVYSKYPVSATPKNDSTVVVQVRDFAVNALEITIGNR